MLSMLEPVQKNRRHDNGYGAPVLTRVLHEGFGFYGQVGVRFSGKIDRASRCGAKAKYCSHDQIVQIVTKQ
jgi:hypothetical protein